MTVLALGLFLSATALTALAYLEYVRKYVASDISPNRWSWLIWTTTTGVEVFTFHAVSRDFATSFVFVLSFFACLTITVLVWSRGAWRRPSTTELICAGSAVLAMTTALVFGKVGWAHFVMLLALPLSFAPTYQNAWQDYRREHVSSWMLWTLGDLAALGYVITRFDANQELFYASVEALCHGGVWLIVSIRRATALRTEPAHTEPNPPLVLPASYTRIGENHLGKAVFAARDFAPGALIMQFGGSPILGAKVPRIYLGAADRYMQIDHDLYLGPSGHADDYVNHSCDPNGGIRFASYGVFLVALQHIRTGEEICWDYSTSLHLNNWAMRCDCRTPACRNYVGEFLTLPRYRQEYYLAAAVVAPYIVKWLEARAVRAYARSEASTEEAAQTATRELEAGPTVTDMISRVSAFVTERKAESIKKPEEEGVNSETWLQLATKRRR